MDLEIASNSELIHPAGGSGPARTVADRVRAIVHARRSVSRYAAREWVVRSLEIEHPTLTPDAVESIIDVLCDAGDIGKGAIHGETVLFSLPMRRVALPDGKIIALGDHGKGDSDRSDLLFPLADGSATATLVDLLGADESVELSGLPVFPRQGSWPQGIEMPASVRRALTLCSNFDPARSAWSMSEQNALFLNGWFGAAWQDEEGVEGAGVDEEQQLVICAGPDARLVVEAGPGSGKTYVACERVRKLVQGGGVAPSRILLLSFTRLAVAELRNRIGKTEAEAEGDDLGAVQILTFDSFAARLNNASGNETGGGYDAGIRSAAKLLTSGDYLVADQVGQIEHLIIDEAQDLVGDRKALCLALLKLLNPGCGVTVFGDFAQAIYGYQAPRGEASTFLTDVATLPDFQSRTLSSDHRTKSPALAKMFQDVRQELRADGERDTYFAVRERIRESAVEGDISEFASNTSTTTGLILTRGRAGLIAAAEAMRIRGRRFRIHLPDRPLVVEPWIGATLSGLPASQAVSREMFGALYADLYPACPKAPGECWEVLKSLDGSGRAAVSVGRVAEALEDPPLELVCKYEGSAGPLLSTIHGLKGGEDQRVMLLLTRAPSLDETDWNEEARILYVGATRAVRELRTGWISPAKLYRTGDPIRHWAPKSGHRLAEVGLDGDLLDWEALLRTGCVTDPKSTIEEIWSAAVAEKPAEAITDSNGNLILSVAGRKTPVGCFSETFSSFIREICGTEDDALLPARIDGFTISGATTIVVPGARSERPTLAVMPLLGGFARVPR